MGSWADLAIEDATLKGVIPIDMRDGDFGTFDTTVKTADRVNNVKRYVEMRVIQRNPLFSERADGPEEFMDAAIDINKAHVNKLIQSMLGFKFAQDFYETEALGTGSYHIEKAAMNGYRFNEAFDAFMGYIVNDSDFFDQLETTTDSNISPFEGVRGWIG